MKKTMTKEWSFKMVGREKYCQFVENDCSLEIVNSTDCADGVRYFQRYAHLNYKLLPFMLFI